MAFSHKKKGAEPPDAKEKRPITRAAKLDAIRKCFQTQPFGGWDERERQVYFEQIGASGMDLDDDLNLILSDLVESKMILLEDQTKPVMEVSNEIVAVYADGGVIKKNPSSIGGTWAWCGVNANGERVIEKSGVVPATEARTVSNNHTEQIAITLALEAMPEGWCGTVYSDSMIALGRVFKGWKETNLPANIAERSRKAVARLGRIETVLLQGHPTKEDLANGIGKKRGFPVSVHNVWCDKACGLAAENYIQNLVS